MKKRSIAHGAFELYHRQGEVSLESLLCQNVGGAVLRIPVLREIVNSRALSVVRRSDPSWQQISLWHGAGEHLQALVPTPNQVPCDVAATVVQGLSRAGDVVLDPFSGTGTVTIEALASGRSVFASDVDPLWARVTEAKTRLADISEVALWMQKAVLRRPVGLTAYAETFSQLFHVDTYRELCNVRELVRSERSHTAATIDAIVSGLLHGPTKTHLVSMPDASSALGRDEYRQVVADDGEPPYRAVVPRVLKATAWMQLGSEPLRARDGKNAPFVKVATRDARHVTFVPNRAVDLVLTQPPGVGEMTLAGQWLRHWFAGVSTEAFADLLFSGDADCWASSMNEVFAEWARVVKSKGAVALLIPVHGRRSVETAVESLRRMLSSSVWSFEQMLSISVPAGGRARPGPEWSVSVFRRTA